jgi:hypothetical protein
MRLNRETTGIKVPNSVHYSIKNKVLYNNHLYTVVGPESKNTTGGPPLIPTIGGNRTKLYRTSRNPGRDVPLHC